MLKDIDSHTDPDSRLCQGAVTFGHLFAQNSTHLKTSQACLGDCLTQTPNYPADNGHLSPFDMIAPLPHPDGLFSQLSHVDI